MCEKTEYTVGHSLIVDGLSGKNEPMLLAKDSSLKRKWLDFALIR